MRALIALGLLGALLTQADTRQAVPRPAVDIAPVVEAAASYVRHYKEQLSSVVASEIYTQEIKAQVPLDRGMAPKRMMRSEMYFMFAPGLDWVDVREVVELNRFPVEDRLDFMGALQTLSPPEVARRFKAFNSRYNLGRVSRNFNEPTLGLLVLDDRHRGRFAFTHVRTQGSGLEQRVTVGFLERKRPTLVTTSKGGPAYSTGELTIDPSNGRVTRTVFAVTIEPVRMSFTTTYARERRLGMWVPSRFDEHYRDGVKGGAYFEEIACEARYTNFRRFEVRARIR